MVGQKITVPRNRTLTDGPARTITLFDGEPPDDDDVDVLVLLLVAPCAITLLPLHDDTSPPPTPTDAADDDDAAAAAARFSSNAAANVLGSNADAPAAGAHSANVALLCCASTAAVTDSMAAATLRGVTMTCGRTAAGGAIAAGSTITCDACAWRAASESEELSNSMRMGCCWSASWSACEGSVFESSLPKERSCGTSEREGNGKLIV